MPSFEQHPLPQKDLISHDLGMLQSAMTIICSFHLLSIQMETELTEIATKILSHKIVWYDIDSQRSTTQ
ncbi:hypothetical protein ACP3W2_26625, partial [Salmonella enterica]|uniref:hypothetical protein n=1 Tax=Salmonella enterica TaxID=28901 RepID=UPI003CF82A5D